MLQQKDSLWNLCIPSCGTGKPECTGNNCRSVHDVHLPDISPVDDTRATAGPGYCHAVRMIAPVAPSLAAVIGQNDDQALIEHSRIFDGVNYPSNQRIGGGNLFKISLRSVPVTMARRINMVQLHKEHIGRMISNVFGCIGHKFGVWHRDAVASTGLLNDSGIDGLPATE